MANFGQNTIQSALQFAQAAQAFAAVGAVGAAGQAEPSATSPVEELAQNELKAYQKQLQHLTVVQIIDVLARLPHIPNNDPRRYERLGLQAKVVQSRIKGRRAHEARSAVDERSGVSWRFSIVRQGSSFV